MIQLKILSGKMAGTTHVARHFPVRVGRAAANHFSVEEPGVWDEHFQIALAGKEGFIFEPHPHVSSTINGSTAERTALRNGDLIGIGGLKIQFSLCETSQKDLRLGESLVWTMVGMITVLQLGLIYWLIR